MTRAINPKPIIGISSCLLGQKVRFDGQHKHDLYLTKTLGVFVEWVPVCPEFEVGMGVPREVVRLVGNVKAPRMIAQRSGRDWTREMNEFSRARASEILKLDISGFIFKKDSPSCGYEKVRVYQSDGQGARREGRGLFAQALLDAAPLLPMEDEGRLNDPKLRENFIERVFAYMHWKKFLKSPSTAALVDFHSRHKLILMAHDQTCLRQLGRIVAAASSRLPGAISDYGKLFMETLSTVATRQNHANVLYHVLGYLSEDLKREERKEMVDLIEDYRRGFLPVVVPMTLMNHHINGKAIAYLQSQHYFNPHPKELMLRNHV
jgi:uncharacterized protein YbgA (DUF1722 family)/uncharacterized protein YbbK (DUF523 family)